MTKSTLQILKEARELISDPARWTQGVPARDEDGRLVDIFSDDACAFCMLGALACSAGEWNASTFRSLSEALGFNSDYGAVAIFNDYERRSHTHVLDRFDAAISTEEQRASA